MTLWADDCQLFVIFIQFDESTTARAVELVVEQWLLIHQVVIIFIHVIVIIFVIFQISIDFVFEDIEIIIQKLDHFINLRHFIVQLFNGIGYFIKQLKHTEENFALFGFIVDS